LKCKSYCRTLAVLGSLLLSPALLADTIFGLYAGVHLWRPDLGGSIGQSADSFSFSSEFNGNSADSESIYLRVEHFVPLFPNVMLRRTPLDWSARSSSATGTLGNLQLSGTIDGAIDLTAIDATGYYELLDNWLTADLGFTLRSLDGEASMREVSSGQEERLSLSSVVPMLYAQARFDLPFTGLAAGMRGNITSYRGNKLVDTETYIHLEVDLLPLIDVGIEAGLRRLELVLDDLDNWNSDADLSGAYIALTAHF